MKATLADSNPSPAFESGPQMIRSQAAPLSAGVTRTLITTLMVLAIIAASASGVLINKAYAPLVVGGIVVVCGLLVLMLKQPVWALFLAVAIGLFPVGVLPDTLHSILNRASTVLALGIWLFNLLMWRQKVRLTHPMILMLLFLIWSAFSMIWAQKLSLSESALLTYAQRFIMCMLLIPNMVRSEKDLDILARAIALVGWLMVILSLFQLATAGYTPGSRFSLFNVNENELGTVAIITTIGTFYNAIKPTHRHRTLNKLITYLFMLAVAGIVAISGSRGSAIALGITLVCFWFFKPTRPYAKLGLFMLIIGFFTAPFIFQTTLERFMVETGDTALGGREEIWQAGWRMIWNNPWLGVGIGNAPQALKTYLVYAKTIASDSSRSLHNPILTVWAETGLFGLILYLGVFFSTAYIFIKTYFQQAARGFHRAVPLMALTGSVYLGFLTSWIKGGGMESEFSYFLLLALLVLPSTLYSAGANGLSKENEGSLALQEPSKSSS